MTLATGTRLGRYEIRSKIGAGGMGEVYLAQDTKLDRKVALKILPAEVAAHPDRMKRFVQEAKTASALNHPNIITIYEVEQIESVNFIATEFIDGETLRERMRKASMKLGEVLDVAVQIASALSAAHAAGIVHRDIKPENVMIRQDGILKVLDFGLAKLTQASVPTLDTEAATKPLIQTEPGRVMGTIGYMSPEQVRGLELDARTDIWSLGVVLYEMLAARAPFAGETSGHIGVSILEKEPLPLRQYAPQVPAELQRIVRKALAKERDERYQTARDLLIDLKNLRRDLDLQSELERSSVPPAPQAVSGSAQVATQYQGSSAATDSTPDMTQARAFQTTSGSAARALETRKRAFTIGLLLLLLGVVAAGYWFFGRSATNTTPIESIAVLPFVNASNDPNSEYFSDGITESIINSLSQLPHTKVLARTTAFRYKGREADPQKVGNELGVDALLTGKVSQQGNTLTIQAELVRVADGVELWGGRYSRNLSDVFAVQSEIANEISTTLRLKLNSDEQKRINRQYTSNVEAYQLYLQGRSYWNKRSAENLRKAISQFGEAISKDPNYAPAYVGLADSYALMEFYAGTPAAENLPLARDAAERALQIDNSLAEAHASLGLINQYSWKWEEAEKEFQRAISLNPNYSTEHQWYSAYLKVERRFDEALQEIKRAQELDPLSPIIGENLAQAHILKNDPDSAIKECQRVIDLDPTFPVSYQDLAVAYLKKGMNREAVAAIEKAVATSNRSSVSLSQLGHIYAINGRRDEARGILKELESRYDAKQSPGTYVAIVCASLGEKDQAFNWLEKDFQSRSAVLPFVTHWSWFDSMRSDSRYADLMRRMGLKP